MIGFNTNSTSLLIAGPFSLNGLIMVEKYLSKFHSIVISTYLNRDCQYIKELKEKYSNLSNIKIIENTLPKINNYHNSQNIYYQCFSVIKGLECINTQFVIKLRSDEYYTNLDTILKTLPTDKISTNNVFVRDVSYKPFHLSDHMIVGG